VLHGFKKKTNKIANDDLQKAKDRFSGVKARVAHNEKKRKKGKDQKHA
jgi:phage-related protein